MRGKARLRVAIDATQIDNQNLGSGQFRYAVDLVSGLCESTEVDLTLLGSRPQPAEEFRGALAAHRDHCRYVAFEPYRGSGYFYRDILRLTWWLATHRVDVFHQLHTNIPPLAPCPVVVTTYHYFEDSVLFATRPYRYYLWALRRRADLVLPISDATREDMHQHFGVPRARMRTVHLGLSRSFVPAAAGVPERPFLLSPYNLSPPKNLTSLLLAWPVIAERHPDLELVLYGQAHVTPAREAAFAQLLARTPHADRVRRTGLIADDALAGLYERCALFVFPTTVEGFGYPLLEAMAHGACCITRRASAMQEVGGNAVRLVETLNPDEIAAAANQLLDDGAMRAELAARARQRAAQFTVAAMVEGTVKCYRTVAGRDSQ